MDIIHLLPDSVANQIAAGEVIERPSSVVKEMVENSIDAGAKNINVEIKNGGISYIKITDNGKGIAHDDLEIAFERHATSKIRSADDLSTVMSKGFRGEALASIAAIARVEMISKKENTETAHKIVVEGGKTLEFTEAARNVGTTITVQNLFYNTPVRYKFLKKDYTEAGYIEDAVTRIKNSSLLDMKTALIYARVSSSGTLENRQNTERQVSDLVEYATKSGLLVTQVFEEHISGAKKNGERVVLTECIDYAVTNGVEVVLFSELSRCGRAVWEVLESIKTLKDNNINAYFLKEGL